MNKLYFRNKLKTLIIFCFILIFLPALLLPYIAGKSSNRALSDDAYELINTAFKDLEQPWFDYHAHLLGMGTDDLFVNPKMLSLAHPYQYYRYLVYRRAAGIQSNKLTEGNKQYIERLKNLISGFPQPGQTLLLAFDKFYTPEGQYLEQETEFYVSNDYTASFAQTSPQLFQAAVSIHPYQSEALKQLEQWHEKGKRFIKWLPNAMGIDPSDEKLEPFFERVKQLDMVILTHVGYEMAVESAAHQSYGNPLLWRRALDMGTKVIFAHVGSLGQCQDIEANSKEDTDCFDLAIRMLSEPQYQQNLFADISATVFINRKEKVLKTLLANQELHSRLINGSDYPIPAINAMVSTKLLAYRGFLTGKEAVLLTEIYHHNPLLFDFVLKRTLRHPDTQQSFSKSIFYENKNI